MRFRYAILIVLFVASLVLAAGCTAPSTGPAVQAPPAATQTPAPQAPGNTQSPGTSSTQSGSGGVDTMVNVRFNDVSCLDIQTALGVTYLYPDQKYAVRVGLPVTGTANVNALLLDTQDHTKLISVPPAWDDIKKVWVYEGIVPLLQFNDITTPQQKTITIKNQGKYFLCIDDRKESGTSDSTFRVPVKIDRV